MRQHAHVDFQLFSQKSSGIPAFGGRVGGGAVAGGGGGGSLALGNAAMEISTSHVPPSCVCSCVCTTMCLCVCAHEIKCVCF